MEADDMPAMEGQETSSLSYKQPEVNLSRKPTAVANVTAESGVHQTNFWRSAKWSPDGSCILTQEEDRLAKIFALPPELVEISNAITLRQHLSLPAAPAALLGLEWFPFAAYSRPETFCFVKSVRDLPVQLFDGNTGKVRASYAIIDHQERFVGPNSMTFSPDGRKLYCGFENGIECFDVANPGAMGARHMLSPSRKAKQGQKGLISALALSPDGSGLLAAGSFSKSLCLYDASGGEPRLISSLKSKYPAHKGAGVTQVKFHPANPEYIYATSRRMNHILVWDVRNTKDVVMALPRPGNTHQRIEFEIDARGKWLTTGDTHGNVHFFDTEDTECTTPAATFKLADDTISSASLHPLLPALLTTSGSRHFLPQRRPISDDGSSSSSESSEDESASSSQSAGNDVMLPSNAKGTQSAGKAPVESLLSLWSLQ